MISLSRVAIATLSLITTAPALAQSAAFPTRPVKVIVTFTSGGAADITARIVGDQLAKMWNQRVVVDNRSGAGGSIGVEAVHRSPADGYMLLLASNTHAINQALFPKLPFDIIKDFVALGLATSTPIVLAVNQRVPVGTLREFTDLLRSKPDQIKYASCGVGSGHHFAMELYKIATRTSAVHIPYRGCTPAVTDAVAGQVDAVISSLAAVLPFARQDKLRILGLTTMNRSPSAPNLPTFRESGLPELKDFAVESYLGFMAPAGIPVDIAAKIEGDIQKILVMPEVRARLGAAGLDMFPHSSAQMLALLTNDIQQYKRAIELAGIKPE